MTEATVSRPTRPAAPALTQGSPRFADSRLATLAREQGDAAAWRTALKLGATQAAVAATGDFAVGITDESGRVFLAVDRFAVHSLCYRVIDGILHLLRQRQGGL